MLTPEDVKGIENATSINAQQAELEKCLEAKNLQASPMSLSITQHFQEYWQQGKCMPAQEVKYAAISLIELCYLRIKERTNKELAYITRKRIKEFISQHYFYPGEHGCSTTVRENLPGKYSIDALKSVLINLLDKQAQDTSFVFPEILESVSDNIDILLGLQVATDDNLSAMTQHKEGNNFDEYQLYLIEDVLLEALTKYNQRVQLQVFEKETGAMEDPEHKNTLLFILNSQHIVLNEKIELYDEFKNDKTLASAFKKCIESLEHKKDKVNDANFLKITLNSAGKNAQEKISLFEKELAEQAKIAELLSDELHNKNPNYRSILTINDQSAQVRLMMLDNYKKKEGLSPLPEEEKILAPKKNISEQIQKLKQELSNFINQSDNHAWAVEIAKDLLAVLNGCDLALM